MCKSQIYFHATWLSMWLECLKKFHWESQNNKKNWHKQNDRNMHIVDIYMDCVTKAQKPWMTNSNNNFTRWLICDWNVMRIKLNAICWQNNSTKRVYFYFFIIICKSNRIKSTFTCFFLLWWHLHIVVSMNIFDVNSILYANKKGNGKKTIDFTDYSKAF